MISNYYCGKTVVVLRFSQKLKVKGGYLHFFWPPKHLNVLAMGSTLVHRTAMYSNNQCVADGGTLLASSSPDLFFQCSTLCLYVPCTLVHVAVKCFKNSTRISRGGVGKLIGLQWLNDKVTSRSCFWMHVHACIEACQL